MRSIAPSAEVPIINIAGYLASDTDAKKKVVAEFREACENQGFLQVTGHSVPSKLQARYISVLAEFFALPLEEKEKVSQSKSECNRGYERIGGQKLDDDPNATADQKESFSARQDRPLGRFLQGPNQWPESLPHFKEVYTEYYNATHQLSQKLFGLMALSLDLPEDYFADFASDPDGICLCRSHHYPPTPPDQTGRTRGVGAHTDFGAMTLLLQDDIGGLEVLDKRTNTWRDVDPVNGAYVVNIGDLMERWTNNRYKSTMHRVISPRSGKDRYSCAFFNDGMLDKIIECIPTCLKPGEKPLYEPIKVEDHQIKRYIQSYGAGGTVIKGAKVVQV